jgi:deoxyribodipyrimidine photolyase-related protein
VPARVVADAAAREDVPLASREGFVRQILGWREFVHHVHEETDGFRHMPGAPAPPVASAPGDGGYARWKGVPWRGSAASAHATGDGGSEVSALSAAADVPPAYWGARSGLRCVDEVVRSVWDEAYSHHITRLMVLANVATLLDVSPRALADWFWVAYADAYDWVVEPNVMAMGTFGTGELMTTKPYVAGSAYIDKMSDYCEGCRFDPAKTCPFPSMYWAYLGRHREALQGVQRIKLPLASEAKRTAAQKERDRGVFERVQAALLRGEELEPAR